MIESNYNVIAAMQQYRKEKLSNMIPMSKEIVLSRIEGMFLLLRPGLKKYLKKEEFADLEKKAKAMDVDLKFAAYEEMQDYLFNKGPLQFGVRRKVDTTDAFNEDESKGL
jgi:hypothetical protein